MLAKLKALMISKQAKNANGDSFPKRKRTAGHNLPVTVLLRK
jgi:hypothetical protein